MKGFFFYTLSFSKLLYRNITARYRTLPQLYVLGAPKCGTTSIYGILKQHPNFVQPFIQIKELSYLQDIPNFVPYSYNGITGVLFNLLFSKYSDTDSYRKFFPLQQEMRSIRKKTGSNAIASDFTPIYLYCPIAAKRIRQLTPNARLIIMLRNPVDRAYSEYRMFKSANVDPRSFEQAIEDGFNNVSLSNYVLDTYVSRGIYEPYVKMYYDLFNKEQIMIIKSEDFFSKPEKVLKDILAFLDLPQDSFNINDDLVDKNQGDYDATIKEETRRLLQNYYQPHNHSLYNLLGVDMEWDART